MFRLFIFNGYNASNTVCIINGYISKTKIVMKKEDAIKYLQQLYPNGGHCWLDEQRIEAISMAVKALQEEPVSEDLKEAAISYAATGEFLDNGKEMIDFQKEKSFIAGASWQKEQMMKDAVDGWVFRDIKGGKLRISDNKECWNGIRIPEKSIEKSYLFCTTDDAIKVKLVIVKED